MEYLSFASLAPFPHFDATILTGARGQSGESILSSYCAPDMGQVTGLSQIRTHLNIESNGFAHQLASTAMLLAGNAINFTQKLIRERNHHPGCHRKTSQYSFSIYEFNTISILVLVKRPVCWPQMGSGSLAALVPKKPGPRRSHKLDSQVMEFLQQLRSEDSSLRPPDLARRILERFGRKVHPRSVERALARQEKKRQ
jgi:hypothetical protein